MTRLGTQEFAAMFRAASAIWLANTDLLGALDAVTGDGDHGVTIERAAKAIRTIADGPQPEFPNVMIKEVATALLETDGGAVGPLLGTLFNGVARAVKKNGAPGPGEVSVVFDTGLMSMQRITKAQVGDKTMIDAIVPAIEAMKAAEAAGEGVESTLSRGAVAARDGASATEMMQASHGRAKYLRERSAGTHDPGAVSVSLMFCGFAQALSPEFEIPALAASAPSSA